MLLQAVVPRFQSNFDFRLGVGSAAEGAEGLALAGRPGQFDVPGAVFRSAWDIGGWLIHSGNMVTDSVARN